MSTDDLQAAYESALEEWRKKGAVEEAPADPERRGYPRVRFVRGRGDLPFAPGVYALDVCAGGIAFCSRQPLRRDDRVDIVVDDEAPASVRVIDCQFSDFDPDTMATHYRINCAVEDESAGMQLFLHVLRYDGMDMRLSQQSGP